MILSKDSLFKILYAFVIASLLVSLSFGMGSYVLAAAGDENWDASFGVPGMDVSVYALAVSPEGYLYAGGDFTTAGGVTANYIARWDGLTWSDLDGGMDNSVWALAFDGVGNLYAAGDFTTAGGVSANRVARWDGIAWYPLGSGMNGPISALAVDESDQLYAGGAFNNAGGISANRTARWDGSQWYALGTGMNSPVRSLAFSSSGDLYAGGVFTVAGGVAADRIARWDGSQWYALGSGLNNTAWAMQFDGSGDLYVGGGFTVAGGLPANRIARWDGVSWYPLGGGVDNVVRALALDGDGRLSVGGDFVTAGGMPFNYIARWDGANWLALGSGMDNPVRALAPNAPGDLYVGGDFTTAGDKTANYIAWWHRSFYPPVANDNSYTTQEDTPFVAAAPGVLENDTDADGNSLTAVLQSGPNDGSLTLNLDGSFVYTPTLNFNGTSLFTYFASDGIYTDTATVTITVTPENDPPVAASDVYTTTEDSELGVPAPGVLLNDLDVDGDPLEVSLNSDASFGSLTLNPGGSFTYLPAGDFYGVDTFIYNLTDGVFTRTAVVTLTVLSVNDPPVALGDSANTNQDAPVTTGNVLTNDTDVDGGELYVDSYNDSGTLGLVSYNGDGTFDYDPDGQFDWLADGEGAQDTFTYTVADGQGGFDSAPVTITVLGLNDAPLPVDDSYNTDEDILLIVPAPGVLSNDTDVDGDALSALALTYPAHGLLLLNSDGSFTFTPDENYFGEDSFTYQVSDGVLTDTALVSLTVISVNDPPVALDDDYETDEDTQLVVTAPGVLDNDSDVEHDLLTAVLVSGPTHGTLTLDPNGSFTYTPTANYFGPDVFSYHASDGSDDSPAASVNITVNPLNDVPLVDAGADQNAIEGQFVNFSGTYTDPGVQVVTILWDFGDGGTAADTLNPSHAYADDGVYTVTLTISDDQGGVGSDWLLVTVSNEPPSLSELSDRMLIAGDELDITLSFTDAGLVDRHRVTVFWGDGTQESHDLDLGLRTTNAAHIYTAPGVYTATVMVEDDDGGQDSETFTVIVTPAFYSIHLPVVFRRN